MTPLWTVDTVAGALGTTFRGEGAPAFTGVSIDSRSVNPGDLFFALRGERLDGHAYVGAALEAGAAAVVVADPSCVPAGGACFVVDDTQAALEALARAARTRFGGKVVGLTGSVGKTSTKEMLRTAIEVGCQLRVHASDGNLNNHIGVPLSLARMPEDADVAVFEMGMNHAGEISALSRLVRPDVALVTTISPAHLAFFRDLDAIADAKAEIFDGLESGGTAVLGRDGRYYERLRERALKNDAWYIVSFGESPYANVRMMDYALGAGRVDVTVSAEGRPISYSMPVEGVQWVCNSMASLAVIRALNLSLEDAARGLASVSAPAGRGLRHCLALPSGEGTFQLVDESYNANPDSMDAAIATLSMLPVGPTGRRIAVLGDMLELGEQENALHERLARQVAERDIDLVFATGPLMARLFEALPERLRGQHTAAPELLMAPLVAALRDGDVVTLKGSHGSGVWKIAAALLETCEPRTATGAPAAPQS
ncbi:UDP-N-acetylmuramoyl-tripeptide--D-alanyl-D-alanine ligase [Phaeovibrio sulfidiphilus]|uniref:UDP-N-acetylmuramoyl-tripeptide--D-alanyl-D-alanine ligase n=1 Tax=Phaeovibrio sulfidiphilus TaxID=1220600 RepID=A0A8J6YML6_9PROT|nr:UDP-N-acetylmuramoyl-tripeptide--D-alanyl-D-alanine ligase [Phaeovibrio sulfidiphilus]MBE1237513.1 UDP-N-acetylmuramoyl-tripeptide--D-alanyl-D-alanine ligase [Phaeovibrio sulfidiphilus]